jgi:1-deoxy-D-xylulose-5-phosphate synthase
MTLPDAYIDHDRHELMIAAAMLDSKAIVARALELLGDEKGAARVMIA